MNKNADKLLMAAVDRITEETFDMRVWSCGAIGCLAHHVCEVTNLEKIKAVAGWMGGFCYDLNGASVVTRDAARAILGISEDQASELFSLLCWPGEFRTQYRSGDRLGALRERVKQFIAEHCPQSPFVNELPKEAK